MQIVFALLVLLPACIQGLKCYSCQSEGNLDPRCEKSPTTVITCNLKYCTTRRQEYQDPVGVVSSFYRGCEEKPLYTNKVVTTPEYIIYYRSCSVDLCNSDNGLGGSSGGATGGGWLDGGQTGGGDGGGTVLAPGTGGGTGVASSVLLVATTLLVLFINTRA